MAHLPESDPGREKLQEDERSLLQTCRNAWAAPLRDLGVTSVSLSRGIPTNVDMPLSSFLSHGGTLFERMPPLTGIDLYRTAHRFSVCESTGGLSAPVAPNPLYLGSCGLTVAGVGTLAASPHLSHLTHLSLMGVEGTRALVAASSHLSHLTSSTLVLRPHRCGC